MMPSPRPPDAPSSSVAIASPADGHGTAPDSPSRPSTRLGDLPPELLLRIVPHVLPEGFESLALSCRAMHTLCVPFIKHHNMLRAQFTTFYYRPFPRQVPGDPLWRPIRHAYDLLERIAAEPVVARYIRHANLSWDNWPPNRVLAPDLADPDGDEPVVGLFANSSYLKHANLDWRQYYHLVADDYACSISERYRFSQHAAAFVLTLLPNARSLMLPILWSPTDTSYNLVNAIISEARESHSPPQHGSSLAQVTRMDPGAHMGPRLTEFIDAVPFLALPRVRSSQCFGSVATGMRPGDLTRKQPQAPFGQTLESVYISQSYIDDVVMVDFLRSTPRLKTFHLQRSVPRNKGPQDWHVGSFLRILEQEAGARIEQLSLGPYAEDGGTMIPAYLSFRGFRRLRELILPLEAFWCTLLFAASRLHKAVEDFTDADLETEELRLGDLLPASLSRLVIKSDGEERDTYALRALFHKFISLRAERLWALEMIELIVWGRGGHPAHESECETLLSKTEPAGVVISTESSEIMSGWDGAEDWESAG